jgi:hypothetical protein
MKPLDVEMAAQFITNFGKNSDGESVLNSTDDYKEAAESLVDIVPAFASEVMNKAKMNALYRGGEEEQIGNKDIVAAAESFKEHIAFTEGVTESTPMEKLGKTTREFFSLVDQHKTLVETVTKDAVKKAAAKS